MRFNLGIEKGFSLKQAFVEMFDFKKQKERKEQQARNDFWALTDVNFQVKRGEVVGLVGTNGAGKSTLLKVVAGVYKPTKGSVQAYGNICPMIELGAGFDPELTAKENYIPTRRADGNHKQFNQMTDEERVAACKANPAYGKIICRCETVTEGDIIDAITAPIPANTIDMLKKRLRAGMGRCQGGFCSPRIAALIAEHSSKSLTTVTKCGGGSWLVSCRTGSEE